MESVHNDSYFNSLKEQVVKGDNVFIAKTAMVLGKVHLADYVNIWYGAVIRGDNDFIRIGKKNKHSRQLRYSC